MNLYYALEALDKLVQIQRYIAGSPPDALTDMGLAKSHIEAATKELACRIRVYIERSSVEKDSK